VLEDRSAEEQAKANNRLLRGLLEDDMGKYKAQKDACRGKSLSICSIPLVNSNELFVRGDKQ
jgi:hypothetical protein